MAMPRYYKLIGRLPVPCSAMEWAHWQAKAGQNANCVAKTYMDDFLVSTIFLGLDHDFGSGKPKLFETMIFGSIDECHQMMRCETWEEAEAQHEQAVRMVQRWFDKGSEVVRQITG